MSFPSFVLVLLACFKACISDFIDAMVFRAWAFLSIADRSDTFNRVAKARCALELGGLVEVAGVFLAAAWYSLTSASL